MKKTIVFVVLLLATLPAQAQFLRFGIKAGVNFSDLHGSYFSEFNGVDIETKAKTSFHVGATMEIKLPILLAIQPELLYSSQGADVESDVFDDIQYDYITVPILLKLYILPNTLSIDLGPQFSFLVNENNDFDVEDSSTFDFAGLAGLGLNLGEHFFLQGRYVIGFTEVTPNADVTNEVVQFSLGYKFGNP